MFSIRVRVLPFSTADEPAPLTWHWLLLNTAGASIQDNAAGKRSTRVSCIIYQQKLVCYQSPPQSPRKPGNRRDAHR